MMGEDHRLLLELVGVQLLDAASHDTVQSLPARRQQAPVNDLMGERVLERVLFGRRCPFQMDELRGLQA
jgi:hypothetical protein